MGGAHNVPMETKAALRPVTQTYVLLEPQDVKDLSALPIPGNTVTSFSKGSRKSDYAIYPAKQDN